MSGTKLSFCEIRETKLANKSVNNSKPSLNVRTCEYDEISRLRFFKSKVFLHSDACAFRLNCDERICWELVSLKRT